MVETIVAFPAVAERPRRGRVRAYSLEELLVAGEMDGAEDAAAELPSDEGAVFVSGAAFFSAGADSLEELLLFDA